MAVMRRDKSLESLSDAELVAIAKAPRTDWVAARKTLMTRHGGIARKAGSKFRRVPPDEVDFITVEVIAASIRNWEGKGEFADYLYRGVCNRIKNHLTRVMKPILDHEFQVRGDDNEDALDGGLDALGARYGGSVTASRTLQAPVDAGITLAALEAVIAALPEADRAVVAARLASGQRLLGREKVAEATGLPLAQVASSTKHLQQVVLRKMPEYANR